MFYKKPKDDEKYRWTNHAADKMAYYRISESLVKRVVRFPKRVEEGIAPGTTACMQSAGSKKNPSEVWVMYQEMQNSKCKSQNENLKSKNKATSYNLQANKLSILGYQPKRKIISAWRYPGVSPVGQPIPIPEDILSELNSGIDEIGE